MLPTSAADRDCQIAAIGLEQFWNPFFVETRDIVEHLIHNRVALKVFDHTWITAGESSQSGLPIGVGETADVEDKVGISGYALAVGERLEQDRHSSLQPVAHALTNQFA